MDQGRDWAKRVAADVGKRVASYREERQISAQQLADRCKALGLPALSRIVITRLENGRRDAVSIAEISVLATALDLAPILLMFPVGQTVEVLPGRFVDALDAVEWFSGSGGTGDVELFKTHRDLVDAWRGEKGPVPLAVFTDSLTEEDQLRWRQAVIVEQTLPKIRAMIRERGLPVPELPPELAWVDDRQVR